MISGVVVTPLKIIEVRGGDVMHALRYFDEGFRGFGEAYFSSIERRAVKAWKRHKKMTLNLVVPVGSVRFAMFDDRAGSESYGIYQIVELSPSNYCRVTVPPMVWTGFTGLGMGLNLLLNVADIPHDDSEVERRNIEDIEFDWEQQR